MPKLQTIAKTGEATVRKLGELSHLMAVSWTIFSVGLRPRYWRRTVREVLALQILLAGARGLPFVLLVALTVGILVVVPAQVWLGRIGQSQLLGSLLVTVIIRELGPLLVNIAVIGRTGSAIAAETGNMSLSGQVRALDSMGVDPFVYLVVPRVVGVIVSVFVLTQVFIVASLGGGYLCGLLIGVSPGGPIAYAEMVVAAVGPGALASLLAKSVVPALLTGVICCTEGFSVHGDRGRLAPATTRAMTRSVAALFLSCLVISILTYL